MEPVASFQGLASGIQFRDLVDQIIAAESRPVVLLEQKKVELDREATAWTDFEFLNGEIFYTLPEAVVLIEQWRRLYNTVRPHSAYGGRPPAPETVKPADWFLRMPQLLGPRTAQGLT
jgi:transposase InsO family protein